MFATNLLLAVSLAVDAFVISVAIGIHHRKTLTPKWIIGIALSFGAFQAGMPLLGWLCGTTFISAIEQFDHWIAFGLLALVGGNMIRNSRRNEDDQPPRILNFFTLLTLSIATSIDALAVGLTLTTITPRPFVTIAFIGIVTTVLCFCGLVAAHRIPKKLANPAELWAGIVLLLIGCKILLG